MALLGRRNGKASLAMTLKSNSLGHKQFATREHQRDRRTLRTKQGFGPFRQPTLREHHERIQSFLSVAVVDRHPQAGASSQTGMVTVTLPVFYATEPEMSTHIWALDRLRAIRLGRTSRDDHLECLTPQTDLCVLSGT
jgi:hypothetical protein